MEKKTIGQFISLLRKANGMTQKDLALRLNISDKTVSRWECDEGAPDLSLIPVIAEIFGVSCDELLLGERKSAEERMESAWKPEAPAKTEKHCRQKVMRELSGEDARVCSYNRKLRLILAIVLSVLIVVTVISQTIISSSFWFEEKTTFNNYDAFVNFMEMDIPEYAYDGHTVSLREKPDTYTDVYGNIISEEEARRNTLFNSDGEILCEYILRNGLVSRVEFDSDADMLPITAYFYQYPTNSELAERDMVFAAIYCAEILGTVFLYLRKRKKKPAQDVETPAPLIA